jgi:hypothetical protein
VKRRILAANTALDARIAWLYGLTRDELRYILDPADVYGPEFLGETFRMLKEKETKLYGEYRTRGDIEFVRRRLICTVPGQNKAGPNSSS